MRGRRGRGSRGGRKKLTPRRSTKETCTALVLTKNRDDEACYDGAKAWDNVAEAWDNGAEACGDGAEACGDNEAGDEACGDNEAGDDASDDDGDEDADEEEDEAVGNELTLGVHEEGCMDLIVHFAEDVRNDDVENDEDSGEDIWNEETIPDPLSSDDEENSGQRREDNDSGELWLGKTFGCADDFKLALLRYSLKTRYDIKLYMSTTLKLGAKCSSMDFDCPWRVYCSYERRKRKMPIKVFVDEHICLRSGYSKMLKRSTIALLFSERLRLNPKLTKYEMAAE